MTNYLVREHPIIHHFIFIDQLYATCWYRILFSLNVCAGPWKNQKYHFLSMGPWEHLEWCDVTRSDTKAPKLPFPAKMTKIPLINLRLTEGQTRSKSTQNNTFHSISSNPSFSDIFSHFDQVWPEVNYKWAQKPNFDSVVGTGWNQCHYESFQIFIPKTIHELKSELER